jgi:hypothetical protein
MEEQQYQIDRYSVGFSVQYSVTTTRSYPNTNTNANDQAKKAKLKELGKMIKVCKIKIRKRLIAVMTFGR